MSHSWAKTLAYLAVVPPVNKQQSGQMNRGQIRKKNLGLKKMRQTEVAWAEQDINVTQRNQYLLFRTNAKKKKEEII